MQQAMNVYRIITCDIHNIFFHQESGATGFVVGSPEPESTEETLILNPHSAILHFEGKVYHDSVPGDSAQHTHENHAVPVTCEVSCLH
jgi:hypothetical protein